MALMVLGLALSAPSRAAADTVDGDRALGRVLAQSGRCDEAVPLLEASEKTSPRPSGQGPLAKCYEERRDLVRARELYAAIAKEPRRLPTWSYWDVVEWQRAPRNVVRLDKLVARLTIAPAEDYPELVVSLDGKKVDEPTEARSVNPEVPLTVKARARGRRPFEQRLTLGRGEERVFELVLERSVEPATAPPPPPRPEPPPPRPAPRPAEVITPEVWLGARFTGLTIPQFVMNAFGDGGSNVFVPGGAITITLPSNERARPEVGFAIAYAYYLMGETPFKDHDAPDTEYEIIESDLMALYATLDVLWNVPLDDQERWFFRVGFSVGIGWTFFGDLTRTQAYPVGDPGDPSSFRKCNGPSDPAGTFRYCNELDKDKDHYNGFSEPSWFEGGSRPLIYPWAALPLGLSVRPDPRASIDLEVGPSLSGIATSLGFRYGI
jgi:hypothetical protein